MNPSEDGPVLAADTWNTNAELIAAVHRLGYIRDADFVLDPTYGRGLWWTKYRPPNLVAKDRKTDPEWDYTTMANILDPASFDVIAFDPEYVAQGGRKTVGAKAKDFEDRFGLADAPATPEELSEKIAFGINNAYVLLKPRGILLVKCMNYISSGKFYPGAHYVWAHATVVLDFVQVTEFIHVSGTGMQPQENLDGSPRRQVHPRNNLSTLFVFRKPKPIKRKQAASNGNPE